MDEERPSFTCPRCERTTFLPSDVAAGYCPACRWWTGDTLLGGEDVLRQAAIDGPEQLAVRASWAVVWSDSEALRYQYLQERVERIRSMMLAALPTMAQMSVALAKVGRAMRSSSTSMESWAKSAGMIRVVEKRLRHGRVRRRVIHLYPKEPRPWKVDR